MDSAKGTNIKVTQGQSAYSGPSFEYIEGFSRTGVAQFNKSNYDNANMKNPGPMRGFFSNGNYQQPAGNQMLADDDTPADNNHALRHGSQHAGSFMLLGGLEPADDDMLSAYRPAGNDVSVGGDGAADDYSIAIEDYRLFDVELGQDEQASIDGQAPGPQRGSSEGLGASTETNLASQPGPVQNKAVQAPVAAPVRQVQKRKRMESRRGQIGRPKYAQPSPSRNQVMGNVQLEARQPAPFQDQAWPQPEVYQQPRPAPSPQAGQYYQPAPVPHPGHSDGRPQTSLPPPPPQVAPHAPAQSPHVQPQQSLPPPLPAHSNPAGPAVPAPAAAPAPQQTFWSGQWEPEDWVDSNGRHLSDRQPVQPHWLPMSVQRRFAAGFGVCTRTIGQMEALAETMERDHWNGQN